MPSSAKSKKRSVHMIETIHSLASKQDRGELETNG